MGKGAQTEAPALAHSLTENIRVFTARPDQKSSKDNLFNSGNQNNIFPKIGTLYWVIKLPIIFFTGKQ